MHFSMNVTHKRYKLGHPQTLLRYFVNFVMTVATVVHRVD